MAERVVGAEDCIAVRVCGGDAVAEEVVGVGFGDGVDAVGVGVRGEEVADGRVGVGLKRRKRRFPDGGAFLNGLAARSTDMTRSPVFRKRRRRLTYFVPGFHVSISSHSISDGW